MNSGIQLISAPVEWKPSSPSAHECWKVSTSTPNDAPAESRLTAAVVSATTTERNTQPMISIVSSTTKPMTHGSRSDMCRSLSRLPAISPPTAQRAPSMPCRAARHERRPQRGDAGPRRSRLAVERRVDGQDLHRAVGGDPDVGSGRRQVRAVPGGAGPPARAGRRSPRRPAAGADRTTTDVCGLLVGERRAQAVQRVRRGDRRRQRLRAVRLQAHRQRRRAPARPVPAPRSPGCGPGGAATGRSSAGHSRGARVPRGEPPQHRHPRAVDAPGRA